MTPKYYVFGDESITNSTVVYALIIVPVESIARAELALSITKEQFGASSTARIHCKELLHEDARRNTEWSHLSNEKAWELLLVVKNNLANLRIGTRVGYVNKNEVINPIAGVGDIKEMAITNDKQLIPFSFYAATGQLMIDPLYAGFCRLWIDPNKDLIKWFNSNAQVGRLLKTNVVDLNKKLINTLMTPENLVSKEKPSLLDIADLLAYSSSRFFSNASKIKKYKGDHAIEQIYKTMNPQVSKFNWANEEDALEGKLENFSVNIK